MNPCISIKDNAAAPVGRPRGGSIAGFLVNLHPPSPLSQSGGRATPPNVRPNSPKIPNVPGLPCKVHHPTPHQPARQTMFNEMQYSYFYDMVDWLFAKSGSLSIVRVFALID